MCMSRVLVDPNQAVSQISRISCSRETTLPCSRTSTRSRSNSLAVGCISWSLNRARRPSGRSAASRSTATPPWGCAAAGPNPGQQLGEPERLGDVVVRAGVETHDGVDLVGAGREDEDRHRLAHRPHAAAHLQTVDERQPEVQDDKVGVVPGALERGPPVGPDVDVVPPRRSARASGSEMAGSSSASSTRVTASMLWDAVAYRPGHTGALRSAKAAAPLRAVAAEGGRAPAGVLDLQPRGEVDVEPEPHRPLGLSQADRRVRGDRPGQLEGPVATVPAGTTSSTHPRASASGASSRRAVNTSEAARDHPTRRVSS